VVELNKQERSELRDLAEIVNFANDTRVPLGYVTEAVVKQLGLRWVRKLNVDREMLIRAIEIANSTEAWYNPLQRELVATQITGRIDQAVDGVFSEACKSVLDGELLESLLRKKRKLKRILGWSYAAHEERHVKKTQSEVHYYFPLTLIAIATCLRWLKSDGSAKTLWARISYLATQIRYASFPQELLAQRTSDGYLKSVIPHYATTEEIAEIEFKQRSPQRRCAQCDYLMPYVLLPKLREWSVPIEEIDHQLTVPTGSTGRSIDSLSVVFPNSVWLVAATTSTDELQKSRDHENLLLQKCDAVRGRRPEWDSIRKRKGRLELEAEAGVLMASPLDEKVRIMDREQILEYWTSLNSIEDLPLHKGLTKVLGGCYIVWTINGHRGLYLNDQALAQKEDLVKLGISLFDLFDRLCSPILYSTSFSMDCCGREKCPVLKAVEDGNPTLLDHYFAGDITPPSKALLDQSDLLKTELLGQYGWVFNKLDQLAQKIDR
jgi:hypothetical protein